MAFHLEEAATEGTATYRVASRRLEGEAGYIEPVGSEKGNNELYGS